MERSMSIMPPRQTTLPRAVTLDASQLGVSEINRFLHRDVPAQEIDTVYIEHPAGMHNLAVGLYTPVDVRILGHAGYYAAGMNQHAHVTVNGNVERGVA